MGNVRRYVRWMDAQGREVLTWFDVSSGGLPGTGDANDIMNEITFVSACAPTWWMEGEVDFEDPVPGWDGYASVSASVRLIFARRGGGEMSITVPAPRTGMFAADGVTPAPANFFDDLVVQCLTDLRDPAGQAPVAFLRAEFRGR